MSEAAYEKQKEIKQSKATENSKKGKIVEK